MSRTLTAGSWLAATTMATAVSWAGVSIVTRDITDAHHRAMSAAQVAALGPPSPATAARPATDPGPAPDTGFTDPPAPVGSSVPVAPPTTTTSPPSAPATTPRRPPAPAAPAAAPAVTPTTATFASAGGVMTVSCRGAAIDLVSARPRNGYRLDVRDAGPDRVDVAFVSDHRGIHQVATCVAGRPESSTDVFDSGNGGGPGGPHKHPGPGSGDSSTTSGGGATRRDVAPRP